MAEGKPFIKCGQLFDCTDAFSYTPETELLFIDAINESLRWHVNNCPEYKAFLAENGLADFKQKYLPELIPPILTSIFKEFKLFSVAEKQAKIELISCGTSGKKSTTILDARSHKRIVKIFENIFASLGLVDHKQKVNYICFTCDPRYDNKTRISFSNSLITDLTAHRSVYYAIKPDKQSGEFKFNLEETIKKIIDFSNHPEPVRIIGFPSYLWQICDWFENNNTYLQLNNRSIVITNGDWNINKTDIHKDILKNRINKFLGIPKENQRDLFNMAEHIIPYVECECGNIHVPIYARAICVDPETLFPVEEGNEGLLQLMTPYISSFPAISLLTTDKAVIGDNCPCGRSGKTFKITGRADLISNLNSIDIQLEFLK